MFILVECAKIVISKCLGFGIIVGSVLVKLPQIIKIINAKSGEGISMASVIFELIAISATLSYGYAKSFPFSSYGEGLFLAIQTALVAVLVLFYSGKTVQCVLFTVLYTLIMSYLLSPLVSIQILAVFQSINIGIVILSKMIQIIANFRNSSTGQLSAITIFLLFTGSITRIFTSIQETGDNLVIMSYVVSSLLNGILTAQVVYYWNVKTKTE